MNTWLLKSEPGTYSIDDLLKDGKTTWDGITNNTALIHLRNMSKGDRVVFYHTGDEMRIVGTATISTAPYPDPKADNPKLVVVEITSGKRVKSPLTLAEIRKDPAFKDWDLLRISRLSVVPVSEAIWKRLALLTGSR